MPSSPKVSSSTHQAIIFSKPWNSKDRHCQTVYDDGRSRCIVETRRRPGVIRDTSLKDTRQVHAMSSTDSSMMRFPERPSPQGTSSYPSSEAPSYKSEGLAQSREKGLKLCLKSPRRVVIISASSRTCTSRPEGQTSSSRRWVEPTPPPTPRLGRLPTPELADLDEAPFCECDRAIVVRCCASCKRMIDHAVY